MADEERVPLLVRTDDGWLVTFTGRSWGNPLRDSKGWVVSDDGTVLEPTQVDGWWLARTEVRPSSIEREREVIVWSEWMILSDGYAPSEKMPARLPAKGFDYEDHPAGAYEREIERRDTEVVVADLTAEGAVVIEDPKPLPASLPAGAKWYPKWSVELSVPRELYYWFPGELGGFQHTFAAWLKDQPGVIDVYGFGASSGDKQANVRVWWSDGRTKAETVKVGRKRVVQHRQTWVTHRVNLNSLPERVPGVDAVAASVRWVELMEEWKGRILELGALECASCSGRGFIVKGTEA